MTDQHRPEPEDLVLLDIAEVATLTHMSIEAARKLMTRSKISAMRFGTSRRVLYKRQDVIDLLKVRSVR